MSAFKKIISYIMLLFFPVLLTACSITGNSLRDEQLTLPTATLTASDFDNSQSLAVVGSGGSEVDAMPTLPACLVGEAQHGQVVDVVDGDTIKVEINGERYTVRYIGIDTPETVHPSKPVEFFGKEASEMNTVLVAGKDVLLYQDVSETDQYGRLLRYVVVGDVFVNDFLVREGYAVVSTYSPDVACADLFEEAQQFSVENELGLWAANEESDDTPEASDQGIRITYIFYDGVNNENEPDEYVVIKNVSDEDISLTGWTLRDQSGKTFIFPEFMIASGQQCQIFTDLDDPSTCGFSFHFSNSAIWNNGGDCAILKNQDQVVVDEYCY